jgi:hypothetical protein
MMKKNKSKKVTHGIDHEGLQQRKNYETIQNMMQGARALSAIQQMPHYFKNVRDELEAKKTKAQSVAVRKKMLDDQKKLNYTQELDRIRGILSCIEPSLRNESIDNLRRREEQLKTMGAKIIDEIK